MPRAFNTPRCRNLGFSMATAQRTYVRSFGCPFMSWGQPWRMRWRDRKIAAAKAKGAVAIFRQSGGQIAEALDGAKPLEQFLDEFEKLPDISPLMDDAKRDIAAGRVMITGIDGGGTDGAA